MSDVAPATDAPISGQDALNALSGDERAHYQLTGELPAPKVSEPPTEPDEDADEPEHVAAPAAEVKPAVTPEKPISKRQQQINDLIRRSTEAELRAKTLEAEVQALKVGKSAAEPKAEPAKPEPVSDPNDPEPQEADFETYREFVLAAGKWAVRQAQREADAEAAKKRQAEADTARRSNFQTKQQGWVQRRDAFAASTPEFVEKAYPFLDRLSPDTPMGDVILEAEIGPRLSLHLAEHSDEAERIARLAPISAFARLVDEAYKLGQANHSVETTSASASAGPAATTVTKAPAPPVTLSARPAEPADDAESALARGDFRAYEAAANRRELART